jgi:hypothetical protein
MRYAFFWWQQRSTDFIRDIEIAERRLNDFVNRQGG